MTSFEIVAHDARSAVMSSDGATAAWVDSAGEVWVGATDGTSRRRIGGAAGVAVELAISGDGSTVAASIMTDTTTQVFVAEEREFELVSSGDASAISPALSDDGSTLVFVTQATAGPAVSSSVMVADRASGSLRRASTPSALAFSPALSADGSTVAYTAARPGEPPSLWVHGIAATPSHPVPTGVLDTPWQASLDTDGSHVAVIAVAGDVATTHVLDLEASTVTRTATSNDTHLDVSLSANGTVVTVIETVPGSSKPSVVQYDRAGRSVVTMIDGATIGIAPSSPISTTDDGSAVLFTAAGSDFGLGDHDTTSDVVIARTCRGRSI